jgi:heptosyltransferase-2
MLKERDANLNIIIRTPKFIGDTIMCLPAIKLLFNHYKNSTFTIVCSSSFVDLFRGYDIKEFIVDDSSSKKGNLTYIKTVKSLRKKRYDIAFLFHNSFSTALIFKLAKVDYIVGYKNAGRDFMLDFSIKIDRTRDYINHYLTLINQFLDNSYTDFLPPKLYTQEDKLLKPTNKKRVGFVLGSDKGSRGYPKDLSLKLFELIKNEDYHIIFLGDREDQKSNSIYSQKVKNSQELSAKTSIAQFIDIIATLDLLVTIDTSAMHIAAATNTDFIALIGKGTSPFCLVKPKVDFGIYLSVEDYKIDDKNRIRAIKPDLIANKIKKSLNNA